MQWLTRPLTALWTALFGDNRPEYEKQRERSFIEAVNKLKNYYVTDRGGIYMDPAEVHDIAIARFLEQRTAASGYTSQVGEPLTGLVHGRVTGYIQIITWRHLPSKTSIRYVCLQSIDEDKFAIAISDFFSGDNHPHPDSFEHRVAQRLRTVERGEPLGWYGSLQEAMDAHDADI